jgi:rubredoxin
MPSPKRCPDCGVELEALEIRTADGFKLQVKTDEPRRGLLGGLGAKEKLTPAAHVCPECGLTRLYVEQNPE